MTTPSYDEIRQQVERRYRRRSLFIYHIIIAFACLTVIWFTASPLSKAPEAITALWFGLLLIHGVRVFMDGARDRAIERTWRRYYGDLPYADEKPKRDVLQLADEDEMLDIVDENEYERLKRSYGE